LLHPESGEVEYVSAGHTPPLIRRSGGQVEQVKDGGPVLGIMKSIRYVAGRVVLGPGDAMVLYSDGVTEAPNLEEVEFGEARLEESLAKLDEVNAVEFIRDLRALIWEHAGGAPQADDITTVIVRRLA
jgi:sigma-B regulation protein RsbU (phosphoserine phosphatase)